MNPIFVFNHDCKLENWQVVDDIVMGGRSNGQLSLNSYGNGVFKGNVSIENNGGFSSIQLNLDGVKTVKNQVIELQLKGDGSLFQFRIKAAKYDRHSYVYDFKTTGKWETILVPLNKMYPSFRGYTLDIPNFDQSQIERIGFLKASKKNSTFQLEIKSISLSAMLSFF
jgi:hypothetical protein